MSKKMRWTAGIIYGVLAIYEMLILRYILQNASIMDIPVAWIFQIILMIAAGVMAVWLLMAPSPLSVEKRRAVTVGTALVVAFQLVTYSTQVLVIDFAVSLFFPNLLTTGSTMYQLVGMLIRMLLLVLGAFFIQSAAQEIDANDELEEAEEAKEVEEESTEEEAGDETDEVKKEES